MSAAGCLSLDEEALRSTLADCAEVRSFLGSATATEALTRIYRGDFPKPADGVALTLAEHQAIRPCILIRRPLHDGYAWTRIAELSWRQSGKAVVQFIRTLAEAEVVDGNPTAQADRDMDDLIGQILAGLAAMSGGSGTSGQYLDFYRMVVQLGPYSGDPKQIASMGLWQAVDLLVEFGPGGLAG